MYEVFLPHQDIAALQEIRIGVESDAQIPDLRDRCDASSEKIKHKKFPYVYSGVLLAKKGRFDESIEMLGRGFSSNPFAHQLANYLRERRTLIPLVKPFSSSKTYDTWGKTKFYSAHRELTTRHTVTFAKHHLSANTCPTILDIGPGNGVLITDIINSLARTMGLREATLILLDQSAGMIDSAVVYCRENAIIPVHLVTIEEKIQSLDNKQVATLRAACPIWFVNASASLHHMPEDVKGKTLRMLSELSQFCLLTEFEANNDVPEEDTPEFVFSVVQHYGYYLEDVLNCGADPEEIKACIQEFLLAEALTMLANDRDHRVDYHTTAERWSQVAESSGYRQIFYTPSVEIKGEKLVTFTIGFESIK